MKKRRGAALAGAIMLCSLIIVVSLGVSVVFMTLSANNIVRRIERENTLSYQHAFNVFVESNGETTPESTNRHTFKIYEKDEDIKGLVAYSKTDNQMSFYAIYDFSIHETLAYQESHFDIVEIEGVNYLAGLVPMEDE